MKQTIILIFVSLTAYGFTSSAQQATTWTNPYFYYHYNTPLELPTQKEATANEMVGNQKQLSGYDNDDHSIVKTLGSHVVLLTTCLRELITTKADLVQTHTEVENVKKELTELKENSQLNSTSAQLLANVMATVENMKKEMTSLVTKTDLAQTTQRLDETHTSQVESVKNELTNVMTTVKNLKKDTDAASAPSSIGRMPQSCDDLQQIGHTKSGLFSLMGNKTVDNVYCDFTKTVNDTGIN
ncbi:hypothetical protein DAPPUDRAFT_250255 [Daphnia pulex]|uniref:Uncharacterized protein n=1 Tax=Daphnia pulex TaxID=6669 RepID=E9GY70_DAPPU|nr:hypothetical protein DAPPUDRAFT_250255 [Daphnia pulex]|eukprot:EFX75549.1 hypothetical protein DAPPUDRAFT_250255 [Daphnia pulex]